MSQADEFAKLDALGTRGLFPEAELSAEKARLLGAQTAISAVASTLAENKRPRMRDRRYALQRNPPLGCGCVGCAVPIPVMFATALLPLWIHRRWRHGTGLPR